MRISLHFVADDWHSLTFEEESDWKTAVDIFAARVQERFLGPIEDIEDRDYAGFAVLALDCLLIEMLQQFREGVYRTPAGKSNLYFTRFLTETSFGDHFTRKMAETFYRQIRCGILHQAEIRGSSRILVDPQIPLVAYTEDQKGLVVNRRKFHERVVKEFQSYCDLIGDPANEIPRRRFLKKMNGICDTACKVI